MVANETNSMARGFRPHLCTINHIARRRGTRAHQPRRQHEPTEHTNCCAAPSFCEWPGGLASTEHARDVSASTAWRLVAQSIKRHRGVERATPVRSGRSGQHALPFNQPNERRQVRTCPFPTAPIRTSCSGSRVDRTPDRRRLRRWSESVRACSTRPPPGCHPCRNRARSGSC